MAKPQVEDGHTKIANELLDALCRNSPGHGELQVFMAIIRLTYGWNKKEDKISYSQLQGITGLSRRWTIYCLQNLKAKNLITIYHNGDADQINIISIQKDYDKWDMSAVDYKYDVQLASKRNKYHKKIVAPVQRNDTSTMQIVAPVQRNDTSTMQIVAPVQRNDNTSAEKPVLPVQRNEKNSEFSAPTKDIKDITKDNTKESNAILVLPDWIKKETWDAFVEMRVKIKAPLTAYAKELAVKKLEQFRTDGENPNEILDKAIMGSWKGLYSTKDKKGKQPINKEHWGVR